MLLLNPYLLAGLALLVLLWIWRALSRPRESQSVAFQPMARQLRPYTRAQVAEHATAKDAWVIVKGRVYDVTAYVEEHPGGAAILKNAGGDATEGFQGPQHPPRVFDIIDDFLIGDCID